MHVPGKKENDVHLGMLGNSHSVPFVVTFLTCFLKSVHFTKCFGLCVGKIICKFYAKGDNEPIVCEGGSSHLYLKILALNEAQSDCIAVLDTPSGRLLSCQLDVPLS